MSRLRRALPWLTILLLCIMAITPLLREDHPCTHDGGLHYYRVVAMRSALDQGVFFTRWLPDLAFGYGYPFFNYRASVSYYLALGFYLTGIPLPMALDLVYVVSILACGLGAYLLARDLFGENAGMVASVAYAYAPYQFLDALLRGNAPESVALALMPFVLWAFRRLTLEGGRRWFLGSAILLSVFFLTHAISNLLFLPYLLLYVGLLWLAYRRSANWKWALLAIALALALTSFYWLPALAEKGYAQLEMSVVTRNNDFHYNFLQLGEILSLPTPVDTSLMNPPMEIHLGLVQTVLAGLGLAIGLSRSRTQVLASPAENVQQTLNLERRASLLFFALSTLVFVFLSTESSVWLWEQIPLISFVQFPWRLIGRAALPVSLLIAGIFATPATGSGKGQRTQSVALLTAIAILLLTAIPATYPPLGYCTSNPYPTVEDIHLYEHRSQLVGVDPEGSYFPVWVEQRPIGSPMEEQYASGQTVTRFDETSLPAGAQLVEAEYGFNNARLVIDSPTPFQARYNTFYFPGWRVTIDGTQADITPSDPAGLITFALPAGRHTIDISFGETPLRLTVDAVSIIALALLLIVSTRRLPQTEHLVSAALSSPVAILIALAVLLLTFKLTVVDRADTIFRQPSLQPNMTLPSVSHPLNQPYGDGMLLLGYDIDTSTLPADGNLRVDLYWTVTAQPAAHYQVVVQLVGPDGFLWSHQNSFRPRGFHRPLPSYTWSPGRYALDSHEIEPLLGTPPGPYDVVVTIFDWDTLTPLSVLDELGQPAAPQLTLTQVELTAPAEGAEAPGQERIDLPLEQITLLSASFERDQAAPGDPVSLALVWRVEESPLSSDSATLTLLDSDGDPVAEFNLALGQTWHPTSAWRPGDIWRSQHRLTLPADLQTGQYTWKIALSGTEQSADVGSSIQIDAPSHTFDQPPFQQIVDITLGELATLVGFSIEPETPTAGETIAVTLVWRAEETPTAAYRIFLHLLDESGRLVTQSDGIPAGWTRPTTGWLPGEYITDVRTLDLPAGGSGEYLLTAGMYIPPSDRLTTPEGYDVVQLTTIDVEGE